MFLQEREMNWYQFIIDKILDNFIEALQQQQQTQILVHFVPLQQSPVSRDECLPTRDREQGDSGHQRFWLIRHVYQMRIHWGAMVDHLTLTSWVENWLSEIKGVIQIYSVWFETTIKK